MFVRASSFRLPPSSEVRVTSRCLIRHTIMSCMYVGADHHGGAGHRHRTYARTAAGERVPESDGRLFAVLRLPAPRL